MKEKREEILQKWQEEDPEKYENKTESDVELDESDIKECNLLSLDDALTKFLGYYADYSKSRCVYKCVCM